MEAYQIAWRFDPNSPWESTTDADIFSLGFLLYAIVTGRLPCRESGTGESVDEMEHYRQKVDNLFWARQISGCEGSLWREDYNGLLEALGHGRG